MQKNVIVTNHLFKEAIELLKKEVNVTSFKNIKHLENKSFVEALKEAHGIIGFGVQIDDELLQHAPNLEIVSNVAVGYNNFDIEALTKHNIMATNTPDVLTDTVADLMFGLLIASSRRISELDRYVKNGKWTGKLPLKYYGMDVSHKKIGIIGMGRIGEAIAHRAHFGFHMDVLYYSRTRKKHVEEKLSASFCSLDSLLQQSDYVVLITPLTKETKGLLTRREFKLMKESAIFINGSRGQTIIESDLIDALNEGEIAGAGLDVFEQEPIHKDNPLLSMPHVVTVPHIGSSTYETELKMSLLAANNLLAGLRGKKPSCLINESLFDPPKKK